jgi:hypothetical protein
MRALRGDDGEAESGAGAGFRLLLIGYFEGIDSERGIAWRAADSLGLRSFLGCGTERDAARSLDPLAHPATD